MRIRTLLFACLIGVGVQPLAQTKTFVGVRGGIHINSAFIKHTIFPTNLDIDFVYGANAGLIFKHFNFKKVKKRGVEAGFQTGIVFIRRGWRQNFSTGSPLPPYSIAMDYLQFPIEGILYGGKKKTKAFGSLGLYYERLINYEHKNFPDFTLLDRDDFYTYVEDRDHEDQYGFRASLGVFSAFPFGTLQLEVFGSISFRGVFEYGDRATPYPNADSNPIPDQSNLYSIGVSLGYFIGFGKLEL